MSKRMIKITNSDEGRVCSFCKRKDIQAENMSFVDKNSEIVSSLAICKECLKKMSEELSELNREGVERNGC